MGSNQTFPYSTTQRQQMKLLRGKNHLEKKKGTLIQSSGNKPYMQLWQNKIWGTLS